METKRVDRILDWLVGSSKAQKVQRHDAMASGQKHRDHLAIEIGPGRLAMQTEISLHVGRRLRRPLVNGVDTQALVSFQIVEVMRPEGIVRQFHKPLFRRAQRFDERSHVRISLRPGSSLSRSSETTREINAYVRFSNRPFWVKRFQTVYHFSGRCRSRARASLRNRHCGPSIMGSENEAHQSKGRSYRGRTWRTYDLTSSIVPRGTSSHHVVELVFLPIAFGCLLSWGSGLLPAPAEIGPTTPNAVHDPGQRARERHNRFLHATTCGDLHCPTLQPRPFCCADQQYLGCLVEHHPHHLVAAF